MTGITAPPPDVPILNAVVDDRLNNVDYFLPSLGGVEAWIIEIEWIIFRKIEAGLLSPATHALLI